MCLKILTISCFSLCCWVSVFGQIHYSHHFTKKIRKCQMQFIEPTEGMYRVKLLKRDLLMRYDLVLHSESNGLEIRFFIDPKVRGDAPYVSFMAKVSSLAINMDHFDIRTNFFPVEQAAALFHADWAAYADFIPKRLLTEKHFGRLVTIYRRDGRLAHTLLLFDLHNDEVDRRMNSITFSTQPAEPQ